MTLLGDEWGSSKGGLSTLNRELAKHLARQPDVQVTVLLPHYSEKEKQEADDCQVSLATPEPMTGFDSISGLSFTREDHAIDVVIGHGQKLGAPAQAIAKQQKCRRVHIIHTASEELAVFKKSDKAIPEGEEKHQTEIALCKKADVVVAIGPKLTEAFSAYLRPYSKDQHVMNITPGICPEFVKLKRQAVNEEKKFRVLLFGRGDLEDFQLKGYDIAAHAVAGLKDKSYLLIFVGAPEGKEGEIIVKFVNCGISPSQLTVRGFKSRKELGHLFREVDLAIIPSRTEGFGLTALEALSAGLPFLVSENSGFGQAIHALALGWKFVVDSDRAEDWGKAIRRVRQTPRENRLQETLSLRKSYDQKYKWEKQCEKLVKKMQASFLFHSGSEHSKVNKVLRRSLSV